MCTGKPLTVRLKKITEGSEKKDEGSRKKRYIKVPDYEIQVKKDRIALGSIEKLWTESTVNITISPIFN